MKKKRFEVEIIQNVSRKMIVRARDEGEALEFAGKVIDLDPSARTVPATPCGYVVRSVIEKRDVLAQVSDCERCDKTGTHAVGAGIVIECQTCHGIGSVITIPEKKCSE